MGYMDLSGIRERPQIFRCFFIGGLTFKSSTVLVHLKGELGSSPAERTFDVDPLNLTQVILAEE